MVMTPTGVVTAVPTFAHVPSADRSAIVESTAALAADANAIVECTAALEVTSTPLRSAAFPQILTRPGDHAPNRGTPPKPREKGNPPQTRRVFHSIFIFSI